ncbi:MAG: hypothetical protein V1735_07305 [Nanoarchaeota archaeon]
MVTGAWNNARFTSEEAELNETGNYTLLIDGVNITAACPGLVFSCRAVGITVDECVLSNGKLTARFSAWGASLDKLRLTFQTQDGSLINYETEDVPIALRNLKVTKGAGKEYTVDFDQSPLFKALKVSVPSCIGRFYNYSELPCEDWDKLVSQVSQFSCSGYLSAEERVRCRLDARQAGKKEYDHFYPEECRARIDKGECLKMNKTMQACWEFPTLEARMNCVFRTLQLANISQQKAECDASDQRTSCNSELKRRVLSLIKYRLYNLEEEAERGMDAGLLTKEAVATFVTTVENLQTRFNTAQTKQEKKAILLEARQAWITLNREGKVTP